jgi:hypothetical protein
VLTFMSKAFASMVVQMAFDTKVMSASNSVVYKKKLPIAGEVARQFRGQVSDTRVAPERSGATPPPLAVVVVGSAPAPPLPPGERITCSQPCKRTGSCTITYATSYPGPQLTIVGLVVVRQRVEDVVARPAVLHIGSCADPEHVVARHRRRSRRCRAAAGDVVPLPA